MVYSGRFERRGDFLNHETNIDRLLKARAEIEAALRQSKTHLTILFTDVAGSTAYFERFGDTSGLIMMHRHAELATAAVEEFGGSVVKTIGDSVMAQFPEPALAVRAAVELQRRLLLMNQKLPDRDRLQLRIGINEGAAYSSGADVFGDAVNVAARITKHTGPAQILISRSVREAIALETDLRCTWQGKTAFKGKAELEDTFEVIWTDASAYHGLRAAVTQALKRGDLVAPGLEAGPVAVLGEGAQPTLDFVEQPEPAQTPAPSAIGERYELLGELGQGGMGIVHKARDRETGETVALKVIRPEIAALPEVMERFKTELRLARKITHRNVCRTYEFNRTADGTAYISMEFVEGDSLRDILKRFGGLGFRKATAIAQQICAGLREAHREGIVHRDLKPENVMLTRSGEVKVMDFGIARSVETSTTVSGTITGTPAYMAPEQAEGKAVDQRADIYALGLILYEVYTGEQAMRGETPIAVVMKQIHEPPISPRDVEPALPAYIERAILRCLTKDPAKRLQSVDELEEALTEKPFAKPEPEAHDAPLPVHLTRWQRSDYWLAGLAVVAGIIFGFLFTTTYPYSHGKVPITKQEASDKAQAIVQKVNPSARVSGVELAFHPHTFEGFPSLPYFRHVLVIGLPMANREFGLRSWGWFGEVPIPKVLGRGWVSLDVRGSLLNVRAPNFEPSAKKDGPIDQESSRASAVRYARELFGKDLANIAPTIKVLRTPASNELSIIWNVPESQGGVERIGVSFEPQGLSSVGRDLVQPDTTNLLEQMLLWFLVSWLFAGFLFFLALFLLVLYLKQRLHQRTDRPTALMALCATLALGGCLQPTGATAGWWLPSAAVIAFLVAFALLSVAEHYLTLALSSRAASWQTLFREGLKARYGGLAILRGCCLGLCYLAIHTSLLISLGLLHLAGPSIAWLQIAIQLPVESGLFFISLAILATILVAWCMVAFPVALAHRTGQKPSVLIAAPAALWLVTGFSLPGASAFPLLPLFLFAGLQGLFFSLVLYRYDFLTTVAAIFTIETWLVVYPASVMFSHTQTLSSVLTMLPWFLLATLGPLIYLRPQLAAAYRRIAEVF